MRPLLVLIGGEAWSGKSTVAERIFLRLDNCAWLDGDDVWRVHPFSVDDPRLRLSDLNMAYVVRTYLEASFDYVILSSVVLTVCTITRRILDLIGDIPYDILSFTLLCDELTLAARALERDGEAEPVYIVLEEARVRTDTIQIDTADRTPDEVVDEMLERIGAAVESCGCHNGNAQVL
jgi:hypothetical protein